MDGTAFGDVHQPLPLVSSRSPTGSISRSIWSIMPLVVTARPRSPWHEYVSAAQRDSFQRQPLRLAYIRTVIDVHAPNPARTRS